MSLADRISALAGSVGAAIKADRVRLDALESSVGAGTPSQALKAAILATNPSNYWRLCYGPSETEADALNDLGSLGTDLVIDLNTCGIPGFSSILSDDEKCLRMLGPDITAGQAYAKTSINSATLNPSGDFSICALMTPQGDRYNGDREILAWTKSDDLTQHFGFRISRQISAFTPYMHVGDYGMGQDSYYPTNSPVLVVMTKKNDAASTYLNGRKIVQDAGFYPDWNLPEGTYDLLLGANSTGNTIDGTFAHLAVWYGRRLSDAEIEGLAQAARLGRL